MDKTQGQLYFHLSYLAPVITLNFGGLRSKGQINKLTVSATVNTTVTLTTSMYKAGKSH